MVPMNLPTRVDDLSLLKHAPLCDYLAMYDCVEGGGRLQAEQSVTAFVKEMQQNDQAAAAAKKWVCLLFQGHSDESCLETTDKGQELYEVFFKYQYQLYRGQKKGNFEEAHRYEVNVLRRGIGTIKFKLDRGASAQGSARGRDSEVRGKGQDNQRSSRRQSGTKKACHQIEIGAHADAGNYAASSSARRGSHSTMSSLAKRQRAAFDPPRVTGAHSSTQSEAAEPGKQSIASKKEKKRKANSQKPPVITPSDASEDDKEPPKTRPPNADNSIFHQSKRIANPSRQPHDHDLLEVKTQTNKQHHKGSTSVSQAQLPLTRFPPDDFVSHSSIDGRGAGAPLSGRKHSRKNVSSQSTRPSPNRRPRKINPDRGAQAYANKRMRRISKSTLDGEDGFESTYGSRARFLQEPTIRATLVTAPPLPGKNTRVASEVRSGRKRTRPEFETAFVVSDETALADTHEFLGPDVRLPRPLPKKVRDVHLPPVCGAPTLEHADQFLRDIASNALVTLPEGIEPDVADWTQDKEHDAECDDLGGDDEDEADGVQATSGPPKLPVSAPPRMWAQSRQEVCESFEYFRCYHSGVYSKDDIVRGYLLGAYAASRDVFHHGGKLIISHGGGKSESVLDVRHGRGPKRYQTDQDQEATDKSVRALLKTCKEKRPIVLLADDKYALFPHDLSSRNYTYVVLGLYWISHAWAECQSARDGSGRIVRWKFAFQWCEGQDDPWWLPPRVMTDVTFKPPKSIANWTCPKEDSSLPANANANEDPNTQCEKCGEHSPHVYKQGRMCLNPCCALFWSINGEEPKQLEYREEFLNLVPHKFDMLPNITPTKVVETAGGVTTTYAFSRGWHCTNCGRFSCRYKWECWECANCGLMQVVNGRIRSPKEFWHQRPSKTFLHSQVGKDSGILACRLEPIDLGGNKGFTNRLTFVLPHGRGKIHLILGTPLSNREADDIFQSYQQQAATGELRLRRYPLRNHRARGLLLTNYFSQNSGEPYQYVGGTGQTVPFCDAPDCVRRALALIKERVSFALHTDIPFNEILSAAYMERQKMSFHSDSEKGLGPTVASLSLGSAALMHFRPLVNMDNLKAKNTLALTLILRHGDVLIMDGDGVQKYYEHTVIPVNFRIAATARCIGTA